VTKKAAQSAIVRTKKSRLSSPENFDVGSLVRLSFKGITGARGPWDHDRANFGDLTHMAPLDGKWQSIGVLFTSVGLVVSACWGAEIGWGHPNDRFLVVQFPEGRVVLEQNKLEWAE
jgi:hypothetical protein